MVLIIIFCLLSNNAVASLSKSSSNILDELRPHLIHHIQNQADNRYDVTSLKSPGEGYRGENSQQQLVLEFVPDGVTVRQAAGRPWDLGFRLAGIGYGENIRSLSPADIKAEGNRVEYRYGESNLSPALTEWYLNGPLGLEQGFTLHRPPAGNPSEAGLVLAMNISGTLKAQVASEGTEIHLKAPEGKTFLRFGNLYVFDATGKRLAARFVSTKNGFGIEVDDRFAVYPLSIDPLLFSEDKVTGSDSGADDLFGESVSISGDTAVVGASFENSQGAAYVFVRSGAGWGEQQKLVSTDIAAGDNFGTSVAISGDTIVVGASGDDNVGESSGAAYVFVRSVTTWSQQQKLTASDAQALDFFGSAVAISGETVVVGAWGEDTGGDGAGAAYAFVRSAGVWSEQQKLTASDPAVLDKFGIAVGISGESIVVGAEADDDNGSSSGSAYVFVRSGTTWSQQQKLLPSDGAAFDVFGRSVAISGETVVVGAPSDDDAGSGSGSAYAFVRSAGVWSEQQKLTASDAAILQTFGRSVSLDDQILVVGATGDNTNGTNSGAAYVFERSAGVWSEEAKLTPSDGADFDEFGFSVGISGLSLVVGSWMDDDLGSNSGSVYLYETAQGLDVVANLPGIGVVVFLNNNASMEVLDPSTATAIAVGDIDDSGQDDVIISFPAGTGPDSNGGTWISRNQALALEKLDDKTAELIVAGNFDGFGGDDLFLDFGVDGLSFYLNDTAVAPLTPESPITMKVGDVDNSGQDDVVLSFTAFGTVLFSNFATATVLDASPADVLEVGDIDGNGQDDIAASFAPGSGPGGTGGLFIARNQGPFASLTTLQPLQVTVGDFDGTGQDDFVFDFGGAPGLVIYLNDASGMVLGTVPLVAMTSGDVDNTGQDDLIVSVTGAGTAVFKNLTTVEIWDPTPALHLAVGNIDGN
jgi:hypothetical protein